MFNNAKTISYKGKDVQKIVRVKDNTTFFKKKFDPFSYLTNLSNYEYIKGDSSSLIVVDPSSQFSGLQIVNELEAFNKKEFSLTNEYTLSFRMIIDGVNTNRFGFFLGDNTNFLIFEFRYWTGSNTHITIYNAQGSFSNRTLINHQSFSTFIGYGYPITLTREEELFNFSIESSDTTFCSHNFSINNEEESIQNKFGIYSEGYDSFDIFDFNIIKND